MVERHLLYIGLSRCRRSSTCCMMLEATVSSTNAIVTVRYSDGPRDTHSDVGLRYFIAKAHKIFHGTEVTPLLPHARSLYICNDRTRICICSRLSGRSYCHSGGVGARPVSNGASALRDHDATVPELLEVYRDCCCFVCCGCRGCAGHVDRVAGDALDRRSAVCELLHVWHVPV